jgi:hypothetical protein
MPETPDCGGSHETSTDNGLVMLKRDGDHWTRCLEQCEWQLSNKNGTLLTGIAFGSLHPVTVDKIEAVIRLCGSFPAEFFLNLPDVIIECLPDSILDVLC